MSTNLCLVATPLGGIAVESTSWVGSIEVDGLLRVHAANRVSSQKEVSSALFFVNFLKIQFSRSFTS